MNCVPPDYHISPVGTHAGDRISKKTVPGPFDVPRKTLRKFVTTRLDAMEPMTGKMQVKKSWQLAEQHGLWWAYEGDLPPPEAFQTHGRPRHVPILGPYPSRTIAEALLRRHLERRRD